MPYPTTGQYSGNNSELFVNLLQAAQYQAYEQSIARQLVTVFDVPAGAGKTVQIPVWDSISATVITDESSASITQTNTNSKTISLTEHVVYHAVTDMLRDSSYSDVLSALGEQSGRAIAESMDKQVFDLFSTSSLDERGPGAGAELTVDYILRAAATLRQRKLTGPFYCVITPQQAYNVKKELATAGGNNIPSLSNVGESVLTNYYIGQIAGVMVYESPLLTVDGSGDAVGAVFAPSAFGHAMRGSIDIETQRQAAARATDIVVKAVAGAGAINPDHAVKLTADSVL